MWFYDVVLELHRINLPVVESQWFQMLLQNWNDDLSCTDSVSISPRAFQTARSTECTDPFVKTHSTRSNIFYYAFMDTDSSIVNMSPGRTASFLKFYTCTEFWTFPFVPLRCAVCLLLLVEVEAKPQLWAVGRRLCTSNRLLNGLLDVPKRQLMTVDSKNNTSEV